MATDRNDGPDRSEDRDDQPNEPQNPLEALFAMMGMQPGQQGDMSQLMNGLQNAFSQFGFGAPTPGTRSGVNWTFTKDTARRTVAALGSDPTPSSQQQRSVADAGRLADLWLTDATVFETTPGARVAWSRAEWIEATMPVWQRLVEPVVSSIAEAMATLNADSAEDMPELAPLQSMLAPMMRQAAAGMFGAQVGQGLGKLATEVLSATDIGLPLTEKPGVALLTTNVESFADGLDQSLDDLTLYLVVREAARQRLFSQVAWLGPQLLAYIEHYAREITIDRSALESAIDVGDLGELTPEKMEQLGQQLQGNLFAPTKTPEQVEILGRLETLLALVEGWVDEVTGQATAAWMPNGSALAEVLRRRRAAGGPAEQLLQALVGLELRPRRLRDASNLWAALRTDRGVDGRDAVWKHPDLLPTAADLDDPLGFVSGERASSAEQDDMDAALAKLLEEEQGKQDGAE